MQSKQIKIISLLGIILIVFIGLYMTTWLIGIDSITSAQLSRGLTRRSSRIAAMIVVGITIGITALVFQTITQNRILTPSVIGFDSTFMLSQTFIVFLFGFSSPMLSNPYWNFILSAGLMVLVSFFLYGTILRKGKNNIGLLLLIGLVVRTLMSSITQFITMIMDPDEYLTITSRTMPSLTNMNTNILWYMAIPIMLIVVFLMIRDLKYLDVMVLGEDQAKSLGVDYVRVTNRNLIYIAILISVSTALVGPLMFLGLITVNISRELLKKSYHKPLLISTSILSILFLVAGQYLLQLFEINASLVVIINLIGGIYLIYMLIKGDQK